MVACSLWLELTSNPPISKLAINVAYAVDSISEPLMSCSFSCRTQLAPPGQSSCGGQISFTERNPLELFGFSPALKPGKP